MNKIWIIVFVNIVEFVYFITAGQPVYVSNGTHILSYAKDDEKAAVIYGEAGHMITGMAVDLGHHFLFWTDRSAEHHGIYRSDITGSNVTRIITDVGEVYSISTDWVSRHIYWTDTKRKTVEVSEYDGSSRRVIVSTKLKEPRSVLASPIFGFLFWADHGAKRIERAWLDGSHRRTIVKSKKYLPNQMTIDHKNKKLYWIDGKAYGIFSCDMTGKSTPVRQVNYRRITGRAPGYGLIVFGNTAVISTWFTTAIYSILVKPKQTLYIQEAKNLGTRELFDLISLNSATQPMTFHPCMEPTKGGCSHLCLPTRKLKYQCSCPTFGGLALAEDEKTCQVPIEILLITWEDSVGFISLDSSSTGEVILVGRSTKPGPVVYDPINKIVYWADPADRSLYRACLNGSDQSVLLNSSHGLAIVNSLAFDTETGLLYFINTGKTSSSLDGAVYSWRRVEVIDVHTGNRKTLVRDVTNPVRLVLDTQEKYLYISDNGNAILRCQLDGSDVTTMKDLLPQANSELVSISGSRRIIISGKDDDNDEKNTAKDSYSNTENIYTEPINNAMGIGEIAGTNSEVHGDVMDTERLIDARDSATVKRDIPELGEASELRSLYPGVSENPEADRNSFKTKIVMMESGDESTHMDVVDIGGKPFGSVTVRGSEFYIVDQMSGDVLLHNGSMAVPVLVGRRVRDLHYTTTSMDLDTDHQSACKNAGCSHGCVPLPRQQKDRYRCTCPDGSAAVLGNDGKTCTRPRNFLLYVDLTTINMLSLDRGSDPRPVTLYYGSINSNFVTLTYDDQQDRIFWTDFSSNTIIYISQLASIKPLIFYKAQGAVDSLVVDSDKQRLYWAGTMPPGQWGSGYIARISLKSGGLSSYKTLLSNRNKPKALALHPNGRWLFWVESKGVYLGEKAFSCKTNGKRLREVISSGIFRPNSLVVTKDDLYIAENQGQILVTPNVGGGNLKEIYPVEHIFGLSAIQPGIAASSELSRKDVLFYSDWKTSSIYMVPLATKRPVTIATNLTRPTSIVARYTTADDICDEANPCDDLCVPLVRGEYQCICTDNRTSLVDETRCLTGAQMTTTVSTTTTTSTAAPTTSTTTATTTSTAATTTKKAIVIAPTTKSSTGKKSTPDTYADDIIESTSVPDTETDSHESLDYEYYVDIPRAGETKVNSSDMITPGTTPASVIGEHKPEPKPSPSTRGQKEVVTSSTIRSVKEETLFEGQGRIVDVEDIPDPDRPYFEDCPSGETIIARVPDTDKVAEIPVKPSGFDITGSPLALHCNYEMTDTGVLVPWTGKAEDSHHNVVFTVTDTQHLTSRCEFSVVLQDVDPPLFTFCPPDIKVRSSEQLEYVFWSPPEVVDNVGVSNLTGSHSSGDGFMPGETLVNYTVIDIAGNQQHCFFKVIVLQEAICNLPVIQHGGIVCSHGNRVDGECHISCEADYIVNPIRVFRRTFNCKHPDDIDALNTALSNQKPCLSRLYPSIVKKEFRLLFHGPINKHRTEVTSQLATKITNHLQGAELCLEGMCQIGNMTIPCDLESSHGNSSCLDVEINEFFIIFNVTLRNDTNTEKELPNVIKLLQDIHLELMSLTSLLKLQMNEHTFQAISDSLTARPAAWSCPPGQISETHVCIACPPGTFHNATVDICQFCTKGHYQTREGSVTCDSCDLGQTGPDGAISSNQCHTLPSMDEMTLFMIVTACSFGVVFLCMAITLYLQFQRQQKRNQQASHQKKTRYNMTPNIYVAPPPILKSKLDDNLSPGERSYSIDKKHPINIFANHDYEEMDTSATTPMSLYQNDLYSTTPTGQVPRSLQDFIPGDEIPTGTLSRENTFNNATYSAPWGIKRSDRTGSLRSASGASPGPQRKMSYEYESTFANQSPRTPYSHAQRTPTSDTPLITQSPLLRLKLAAYNLNHED